MSRPTWPWRCTTYLAPVVALAVGLGGCQGLWERATLRLAILDWPGYEFFYLARRRGLDRQLGYELRLNQFSSLQDQRQAYVRGDVEAIATTLPEAMAICRDAPPRCPAIVLVLDQSNGADQLIASSSVSNLASLRGRRVGLERSVLGEFVLLRALQSAGIDLTAVQLRYAGPQALVAQLKAGGLDAIVTYSPHGDALLDDPGWRLLFSSRNIPGEVVDVLAVSPELVRSRSRLVPALVNTWWAAQREAQERPGPSVVLMAQRQGVTPAQFRRSQQWIVYPDRTEQPSLLALNGPVQTTLRRLQGQMQRAGRLPTGVPLPSLHPIPDQ